MYYDPRRNSSSPLAYTAKTSRVSIDWQWTPRLSRTTTARGFSLVEVMVVLVIVGLLAGVVAINARHYLTRGKQSAAKTELSTFTTALEEYYSVYGRYPGNDEGLMALRQPSDKLPEPLITQDPIDPWGRPYQYVSPAADSPYEIICLGADGREGGDGADADLSSLDLKDHQEP